MANIRKDVPAGWQWGGGAPRWIPTPTLRKAGWRAVKLTDAAGGYLTRGPSIDRAEAVNRAVTSWKAGDPIDAAFQAFAPPGAVHGGAAPLLASKDPLSIGVLYDDYLASPELNAQAARTVSDRRGKLKRLVDALVGYHVLPARDDAKGQAAYQAAVAMARSMNIIDALQPGEEGGKVQDPLYTAYWNLHAAAGVHMSSAALVAGSAWLNWCRERRSRRIHNWAAEVSRKTPEGRVRILTWQEIGALVTAADKLGLPYVGDAVVLATDLAWSQVDILSLEWPRIVQGDDGRLRPMDNGRQKTGRKGAPPFLSMGVRRLALIRQRNADKNIEPLKVIHMPRDVNRKRKASSDADFFRHRFAEVRTEAAKACPSVATATFADTRDTGFTLTREAGLDKVQTASRTRHSLNTVDAMGDKHYGEIGQGIADAGADLLDPYVEAQIKKAGVRL